MENKVESRRQERHCAPPPEIVPWLVYPNGKLQKSYIFCSILEPSKTCLKRIPEMRQNEFISSSYGWLVMMACPNIFLFNPVSLETIHLPDIIMGDMESFLVFSCSILWSAPTNPNCLIVMSVGADTPLIMHCRPGDKEWTKQSYEPLGNNYILEAVGLSDGTIFARTTLYNLVKIERDASGRLLPLMSFDVESILSQTPRLFLQILPRHIRYPLLESCGELFHVWPRYVGLESNIVDRAIVFKMDFSKMAWVKVDDIGGRVFFLSESVCTSIFANQYSGIKGNCIYYTLKDDKSLYVYDMEDNSTSVSLPLRDFPRSLTASPFWVMPMTTYSQLQTSTKDNEGRTITDAEINTKAAKQCLKQELSPEMDGNIGTEKFLVLSLAQDVQYQISKHLTSMVDYMNFRSVCKTWRSIAPPIRWRSPWLMVLQRRAAFFLDPECNSIYRINLPGHICDSQIHFSKDGWCLMSQGNNYSMFFYNPLTKMRINLPDLPIPQEFQSFCFTGLPTSPDFIIFGITQFVPREARMCIYVHREESWHCGDLGMDDNEAFSVSANNPVYVDGDFYCLGSDGYLGVWGVKEGKWRVLPNPKPPCSSKDQNFLVETDGELLSVFISDHIQTTFVFKLDRSTMEWVAVESLGDQMLFISPSTSIATKAQEVKKREMQNKIYFPRAWSSSTNTSTDVVFYSLDTESYNSFNDLSLSKSDLFGSRVHSNCTWFQPQFV